MDETQWKLFQKLVTADAACVAGRGFDGLFTVVIRSRLSAEELKYVFGAVTAALEDPKSELWSSSGLPC